MENKAAQRKQTVFAIKQLVSREVKRRYARSYLGIVWSVLNPLLNMAVMSLIFTTIFKRSIANFPIFYLTGNIFWSLFSGATNSGMTSLVDNRGMLMKIKMEKHILVLARVFTALTNFGYSCIAYVCMLLFFRVRPNFCMLLFPVPVFFMLLFAMGIGFGLSIFYVFFDDIKYLYSVFLHLWSVLSALFYPVERLSEGMQKVVKANPVYAYIAFARQLVLEGTVPPLKMWMQIILWGVGSFCVGLLIFKKKENQVMQKI